MKTFKQAGFTLIELMIAITLGLILVAVAIQMLVSGQQNYRIQSSAASLQDSGLFGINYVTKNIRLANHGNASIINDESLYGGIVLSNQTRRHGYSSCGWQFKRFENWNCLADGQ